MKDVTTLTEQMLAAIFNSSIFNGIEITTISELLRSDYITLKQFKPGDTILKVGSKVKRLYLVLEGTVCSCRTNYWNESSNVERFYSGSFIGLESFMDPDKVRRLEYNYQAIMDTEKKKQQLVSVLVIDVNGITADPQFSGETMWNQNLLRIYTNRINALQDLTYELVQQTQADKVKAFLTNQARQFKTNKIHINLDRQAMANRFGQDRASIAVVMSSLQKKNLFTYHKGDFELFDKN
jgi:CRP-like cAMP-binding protein